MPTIELPVAGMTCRACETTISRALSKVPGVASATASSRRGVATVEASGPVSRSGLVAAVRDAGYEVGASDRPWLTRDRRIWRDVAPDASVPGQPRSVARTNLVAGAADRRHESGPRDRPARLDGRHAPPRGRGGSGDTRNLGQCAADLGLARPAGHPRYGKLDGWHECLLRCVRDQDQPRTVQG